MVPSKVKKFCLPRPHKFMNSNFFFGISLTGSFLAGALALFAPCCITFLFPAYLGTIFKDRKHVMFYTLIFALGLSFILIPVALGFRIFIFFFDQSHRSHRRRNCHLAISAGNGVLRRRPGTRGLDAYGDHDRGRLQDALLAGAFMGRRPVGNRADSTDHAYPLPTGHRRRAGRLGQRVWQGRLGPGGGAAAHAVVLYRHRRRARRA